MLIRKCDSCKKEMPPPASPRPVTHVEEMSDGKSGVFLWDFCKECWEDFKSKFGDGRGIILTNHLG